MLMAHKDLKRKIEDMEKKYNYQFKIVFDAIKQLLEPPTEPKGKIGFRALKKIWIYRFLQGNFFGLVCLQYLQKYLLPVAPG